MDEQVRRHRAAAQRLAQGRPRSQVRYPATFRRAAVALAWRRLGPGGSVTPLAREMGVSEPTLDEVAPPASPAGAPAGRGDPGAAAGESRRRRPRCSRSTACASKGSTATPWSPCCRRSDDRLDPAGSSGPTARRLISAWASMA